MSFDPHAYKYNGEVCYEGVIYSDTCHDPSTFHKIQEWKPDPQDVILSSYPKMGVTWLCAIVQHILQDGNDPEYVGPLNPTAPFIEFTFPGQPPELDQVKTMSSPRVIKTHLMAEYYKKPVEEYGSKFIVLYRNPKDTLVSFYHHHQISNACGYFTGTFHEFFKLFQTRRLIYGDPFSWYEGWWKLRHHQNVLSIFYEEMKRDPKRVVLQVSNFLGKGSSDGTVQKIVESTAFDKMAAKAIQETSTKPLYEKMVQNFFRKGTVGDWMNYFSPEEDKIINQMCDERLQTVDLTFAYSE